MTGWWEAYNAQAPRLESSFAFSLLVTLCSPLCSLSLSPFRFWLFVVTHCHHLEQHAHRSLTEVNFKSTAEANYIWALQIESCFLEEEESSSSTTTTTTTTTAEYFVPVRFGKSVEKSTGYVQLCNLLYTSVSSSCVDNAEFLCMLPLPYHLHGHWVCSHSLSVHIVKLSLVCRFWILKNLQSCEFVGFFGGEREREGSHLCVSTLVVAFCLFWC